MWVNGGQASDEMFFEGGYGPFGGVDSVVPWGHELDVYVVLADVLLDGFAALVVHDIECGQKVAGLELVQDGVKCRNHVVVVSVWHGYG